MIRPAVESRGFVALRADEISEPGLITSQVIQRVVESPLVLADLTDRNPNVFYELALRHAVRKPLIQLIRKGESVPFDLSGMRTIPVDHQDLDSVAQAQHEIGLQIDAVVKSDAAGETPLSVAIDLQLMRQSQNPQHRSLADVLEGIAELRAAVARVEAGLSTTGALVKTLFGREQEPRRPVDEDSVREVTFRVALNGLSELALAILGSLFEKETDRLAVLTHIRATGLVEQSAGGHDFESEVSRLLRRGLIREEPGGRLRLHPVVKRLWAERNRTPLGPEV